MSFLIAKIPPINQRLPNFRNLPKPVWIVSSLLLIFVILSGLSCEKREKSEAEKAPEVITTETGVEMLLLPGGWFEMGSGRGRDNESPVHKVWVDAFLMDIYEVTQEQYEKLVIGNPSHFKGATNPMEQISWAQAVLYCNARSRAEGLEPCYDEESVECNFQANGYRLPTEAEWEYACRAGTDTERFFGQEERSLKDYAWYAENSSEKTNPVGKKKPNAWGIYDMYGNVAEWCNDIYDEKYFANSPDKNPRGPTEGEKYVLRGGSWNSSPDACRSSYRAGEDPGFYDACFARDDIGFRCVRKAPQPTSAQPGTVQLASIIKLPIQYPAISLQTPDIQYQTSTTKSPGVKTGLIYHDIYLRHDTGSGHPERPQRLEAITRRLRNSKFGEYLYWIEPERSKELSEWIAAIHTPQYIERVRKSCQEGIRYMDSADTPVSSESYEVAVAAVGGVLSAIDEVMAGRIRNAFCAIRPPGHHALKDRATGFCLFNNVAIGARYLQKKYGLSRILIVDWDVHHGNGTQDAFYNDPTVLYFSTHQYPFYPGTGSEAETGAEEGVGYNINVPLSAGSGDKEYIQAFEEKLRPAAMKFDPDFILISAGFDAHKDDLLGGMEVTTEGFAQMTRIVREIAEKCCAGRIVSVLEGGYELDGLADSVEAHILALHE